MEKCVMKTDRGYFERLKLIQRSPFTVPQTAVLSVLFSHGDYDTGLSWPSISTICEHSKLSKSSVYRALNVLEAARVIQRYSPDRSQFRQGEYESYDPDEDHSLRFHRQSNRYVLRLDVLENLPKVQSGTVVHFRTKCRARRGRGKWAAWGQWSTCWYFITGKAGFSRTGLKLLPGLMRALMNKSVGHKIDAHLPPHLGWGHSYPYEPDQDPNAGLTSEWRLEVLGIRPATEEEVKAKRPSDTWNSADAPSPK
jgi:hypothetical protein